MTSARETASNRADDGSGAPVVELRHTSIGYGARPVVDDVSLRIGRNEVVALVGPNGSGKTTIVRGVLGLAPVVAGEVRLFGVPAGRFSERWRIGYVPQRHTVVGAVPSTVQEVVASGRLARRSWWKPSTAVDRAVVARAIDVVGLSDQRRAPVSTLSGGQQRRVLIARALAADPEILIMDEPTAGVDAASAEALTGTLARLVDDGRTLLIVTHDVAPLAPILTRVVAVADGSIVGDEPARIALSAASALGHGLYAHPGHDPHHQAPDDPTGRPGPPGGLGEPWLRGAPAAG